MRRLVEVALGLLPFDAIGQRAVDETLADWRHEGDEAQTLPQRVWVDIRGALATMSVLVRVTTHELRAPQTWLTIVGVFGLALVFSGLFSWRPATRTWPFVDNHDWTVMAWLWLTLLPQAFAVSLPLALVTPPFARGRAVPFLSLALVTMFAAGHNLAWVRPEANQSFRRTVLESHSTSAAAPSPSEFQVRPREPRRGPAEWSLIQLVRAARRDDGIARRQLLNQAALIAAAPVFLLLGVQAERYSRSRRWTYNAIAAWSAACAVYVLSGITWTTLRWSGLTTGSEWFRFGDVWTIVVMAALVSYGLARLADRSTTAHAS